VAELSGLLTQVRACAACTDLPLGPRPVVQLNPAARLLIIGQAPGTKVHATGVPFNDPSGDTLRRWLGLDRAAFYDETRVALMPMGFCYPGKQGGGDAPPRAACAPLWHGRLRALLPNIRLTILLGRYALSAYLPERAGDSVTEIVRAGPVDHPGVGRLWPLPHPSPRNRRWLAQNPWVEGDIIPAMQADLRGL
jgi:uracil-DNA glycosylase